MTRRTRWIAGGAVALALVGGGAGFAAASSGDDEPLAGPALEQASAAALEHTGGGTVVDSEIGDDGAAYSVEVRRADGSVVEVSLDARFRVIGEEADDAPSGERDGAEGD